MYALFGLLMLTAWPRSYYATDLIQHWRPGRSQAHWHLGLWSIGYARGDLIVVKAWWTDSLDLPPHRQLPRGFDFVTDSPTHIGQTTPKRGWKREWLGLGYTHDWDGQMTSFRAAWAPLWLVARSGRVSG